MNTNSVPGATNHTRRDFLKSSAAAGAGAVLLPAFARSLHPGGRAVLKVGLVGCGGRGSGAALQALKADQETVLWAMGDAFSDRIDGSLAALAEEDVGSRIDVPTERRFTGPLCHEGVIHSGVDVVILCPPPHFRPIQIEAAVKAGKHIFAEKPVAVDAPGVRRVMAACKEAQAKKLAVVSGLCWRYDRAVREVFQRVHGGEIGDIIAMQAVYNAQGLWSKPKLAGMSDLDWQLRNWLYFTWLSGDHIVEQHIHSLDKLMWAMKDEPPVRAVGSGGRQVRTDPVFGHIFDHFNITYEWASGVKGFSSCRQIDGCATETNDHLFGTHGRASVLSFAVDGKTKWRFSGEKNDMYQQEHDELFASIRKGEPINNGDYMCKSTLMAIMGRMAAYTGQMITWDQALNSKEDLTPPHYGSGPLPVPPVPMPGLTKFY